jgi:histidine triad (HIT) family protein
MADTIFSKIIRGEIPTPRVYEDEHCIAIRDIHPRAPVHLLVIPKKAIPRLVDTQAEDQALLGHLLLVARQLAKDHGVADSFRLLINNGEGAGQTVFHLHLHILGNDSYSEADMGHQ